MTHPARARAEKLFQRAAELPRDERGAFLDEKCGDDKPLREEVDSLLAQLDAPVKDFLGTWRPTPATPAPTTAPEPFAAGQVVAGKYKLLEILGEGGLGVVWIAEEAPPVRRRVALKVVKLGMDSKQVLARFETERNALAIMNHPNIARVLDAGMTEAGQPFFAMEHVPGLPITAFCDAERLTVAERLQVFINVCRAVQHAHQKGIIHRDLKPSNIIVMLREGKPVPKVIDFGIAKATGGSLSESTLYTLQGQMVGTPEYMSPEQAEGSGIGVDSTTDIYSLGVVLYELLTGVLPFDSKTLRSCGVAGISEMIREVEPEKPSTRISTLGEDTSTISAAHRTDPRTLRSQLKGDLDWIVLKALDKQRTRRYAAASEFAADIERHLSHEPVLAAAPSIGYRLQKTFRRHRVAFAVSAVVLLALVGGIAGTSWGWLSAVAAEKTAKEKKAEADLQRGIADGLRVDAEKAAVHAETERARAQASMEFLVDLLESTDPAVALRSDMSVRDLLARASVRAEELKDQPEVEAKIRATIGNAYFNFGEMEIARAQLSRALELQDSLIDRSPEALYRILGTLSGTYALGSAKRFTFGKRWLNVGAELIAAEHPVLGRKCLEFGAAMGARRDDPHVVESVAAKLILEGEAKLQPRDPLCMVFVVQLWIRGKILILEDDVGKRTGRRLLEEALRIAQRERPNDTLTAARIIAPLVPVLLAAGDRDAERAETLVEQLLATLRAVLAPDHYDTKAATARLAEVIATRGGRQAEAEAKLAEATAPVFGGRDALAGEEEEAARRTCESAIRVYLAGGNSDDAVRYWKKLASMRGRTARHGELAQDILGKDYPELARLLFQVSRARRASRGLVAKVRAARRAAFGVDDPRALGYAVILQDTVERSANPERVSTMEEVLRIYNAQLPWPHPRIAMALTRLSNVYTNLKGARAPQFKKGEQYARDALAMWDQLNETGPGFLPSSLGACLVGQGSYAAAERHLEEAYEAQRKRLGQHSHNTKMTQQRWLNCLLALDKREEALKVWRIPSENGYYVEWNTGKPVLASHFPKLAAAMEELHIDRKTIQAMIAGRTPKPDAKKLRAAWLAVQAACQDAMIDDGHTFAILYSELLFRIAKDLANPNLASPGAICKEMFAKVLAIQDEQLGAHPKTAQTLWQLTDVDVKNEQWSKAERWARRGLEMLRELEGEQRESARRLYLQTYLGACLCGQKNYEEAEPLLAQAYAALRARLGEHSINTRNIQQRWLGCLVALDKREKALEVWRIPSKNGLYVRWRLGRVRLADRFPELEAAMAKLNDVKPHEVKKLEAAWHAVREARRGKFEDNDTFAILYSELLFSIARRLANPGLASRGAIHSEMFAQVLAIQDEQLGPHPKTALTLWWLAQVDVGNEQWKDAAHAAQRGLEMLEALEGKRESGSRLYLQSTLGACLRGEKNFAEAEAKLEHSYQRLVELEGLHMVRASHTLRRLIDLRYDQGSPERAEPKLRKALQALSAGRVEQNRGFHAWLVVRRPGFSQELCEAARQFAQKRTKRTPRLAQAHIHLGATLYRLKRYDDAITALRKGMSLRGKGPSNPLDHALLAMVLERKGDHDEARKTLERMQELVRRGVSYAYYDRCVLKEAETLLAR